jgi:DNA-binding response OmpR family regulator
MTGRPIDGLMHIDDATAKSLRHLIRILVFTGDDDLMSHVIDDLVDKGYAEITQAHDPDELGATLREQSVDLLISVSQVDHVFIGHFIRDLRHGLLECHPFPIVMMLLPSAEMSHVREVIDAGVDDMLVTPLRGETLTQRLNQFLLDRRPFTVTHDYIGPNRRLVTRPGTKDAPLVHVPNPVRARAFGQDDKTLQESLHEAAMGLSRIKVRSDSVQVGWLLESLISALAEPERNAVTVSDFVSRIAFAANEISRRAGDRSSAPVREQARKVVEATRAIVFTQELVAEAHIKALVASAQRLTDLIDEKF